MDKSIEDRAYKMIVDNPERLNEVLVYNNNFELGDTIDVTARKAEGLLHISVPNNMGNISCLNVDALNDVVSLEPKA